MECWVDGVVDGVVCEWSGGWMCDGRWSGVLMEWLVDGVVGRWSCGWMKWWVNGVVGDGVVGRWSGGWME